MRDGAVLVIPARTNTTVIASHERAEIATMSNSIPMQIQGNNGVEYAILAVSLVILFFTIPGGLDYFFRFRSRPVLRIEPYPQSGYGDDGDDFVSIELPVKNYGKTELRNVSLRAKFQMPYVEQEGSKIDQNRALDDVFLDLDLVDISKQRSRSKTVYPERSTTYVRTELMRIQRVKDLFYVGMSWGNYKFVDWLARAKSQFEFTNGRLEEYKPSTDFHCRAFVDALGVTPAGTPHSYRWYFEVTVPGLGSPDWSPAGIEVTVSTPKRAK
jgi:hypothetical protein